MKLRKGFAGIVAAAMAFGTMAISASAEADIGLLKFNDREFILASGNSVLVGDNMDAANNNARDAVKMPGQQDADNTELGILFSQNGALWSNINSITAHFYVEDTSGECYPEDLGYIQNYIQLGEDAGWSWNSANVNYLEQLTETGFGFGPDFTMEATWDIKSVMDASGSDSAQGGVLKLGLQFGNSGIDDMPLKIVWVDASYDGDTAIVAECLAKYDEMTGAAAAVDTAVEDVATVDATTVDAAAVDAAATVDVAPTAGNTAAATTADSKGSADTGVEGVAVVAALAIIGTGAVVISRKRK